MVIWVAWIYILIYGLYGLSARGRRANGGRYYLWEQS